MADNAFLRRTGVGQLYDGNAEPLGHWRRKCIAVINPKGRRDIFQQPFSPRDTGSVARENRQVMTFARPTIRTLPLAFVLLLFACTEDSAQKAQEVIRPVRAIKVADASNFQERWFSGTAKGTQEIDLSFRVSGPLISRNVDVGSKVKEGDLIAKIDPATFRAEVDEAKANLAVAKAVLQDANEQLGKKQILVDRGVESTAALDTLKAAVGQAEANVQAREAIVNRRELELSYTSLQAPFDGIVVRTYVENFSDVQAKQAVVRLVDNSKIEMTINIPESLISQASTITKGVVRFDALPDLVIPATLKEIGTEASETTRTYPVTIEMEQPEGATILPGMAGRATASEDQLPREASQIVVPETAVFSTSNPDSTLVWIVDEATKTVSSREITTGGLVREGLSVSDGLKPGEWIVTAGVNYLKEGQRVRFLDE